jgi:hypothetical protein|tara:strand:- start:1330 stop:1548 length:219 start_codon:yes stop_codon:yes gene_type:complete
MTNYIFKLKFRKFDEARKFARSLKLKNKKEWDKWCENNISSKPQDIPVLPNVAYKGIGWINYDDWLGVNTNE